MNKNKLSRIIIHCALIFAVLLVAFLLIGKTRLDKASTSFISKDIAIGGNYSDEYRFEVEKSPLVQQFEVTTDILWGLGLDFERNQEYPEGDLEIVVSSAQGEVFFQGIIPISSIRPNKRHWVVFDKIITDIKGQTCEVSLGIKNFHKDDRLAIPLDREPIVQTGILRDVTGELSGNIKIGQMYGQTGHVKMLIYGIMVLLAVATYGLYFALFIKKCKIETVFIGVMIILGTIYAVLMGPGNIPDEGGHFKTAYACSNFLMGKGEWGQVPIEMTKSDATFYFDMNRLPATPERYEKFCREFLRKSNNPDTIILNEYPIRNAPPYLFVGQAIGITVGRLLGFNGLTNFYLGRMFGAFIFAMLAFVAMKKLPFYKPIMFAVCMFPMVLQLVGSLSYDPMILAIALILFAHIVAVTFDDRASMNKGDLIIIAITSILLAGCKGGAYIPLCGLLLLIPSKCFKNSKLKALYMGIIIILSTILFYFTSMQAVASSTGSGTAGLTGKPHYTIGWVFAEPAEFFTVIANTITQRGSGILKSIIGDALGYFNISISLLIVAGFFVVFLMSSVFSVKGEARKVFSGKQKMIVVISSILIIAIVSAAMLFSWTAKGSPIIEGIQGRYFLAIMLPLGFCLKNRKLMLPKFYDKGMILILMYLQIFTIVNILQTTLAI